MHKRLVFVSLLYSTLATANIAGAAVTTPKVTIGVMPLVGELCPVRVDLVCEGVDLTLLEWRYNTSGNPQIKMQLVTFTLTSTDSAQPYQLENRAFIFVQLTSVMANVEDTRFANFTSILTVDVSELKVQNITGIECGDAKYFATKEINFTIIEESAPETPVITIVHATYNESELKTIEVFWQKLVNVQCLLYEVTLLESVGNQSAIVTTNRISQLDCNEKCSTTFTLSGSNLSQVTYQLKLSANNSAGTSFSTLPNPIVESRSSEYVMLAVTFMDCVSWVNCTSNISDNCSLQYIASTDLDNNRSQLELSKNGPLQLQPDTNYLFTATVVSGILVVSEIKSFFTLPAPPQLSPGLNAQISVGVVLVALSLVLLSVMSRFIFKLYQKSTKAKHMWKILISIFLVMVLVLVCVALWITIAVLMGQKSETCNPDWQESRDVVIACSLMFSCLVLAASCFITEITYKASKAHHQNEQTDNGKAKAQKTWRERICKLFTPKNRANASADLNYDHLDYIFPSQMIDDQQRPYTLNPDQTKTGEQLQQLYDEAYPLETKLKTDSSQPPATKSKCLKDTIEQEESSQYDPEAKPERINFIPARAKVLNVGQVEESKMSLQEDTGDQDINSGEKMNGQWIAPSSSHAMANEDSSKEFYENFTVDNVCYKKSRQWSAPELSPAVMLYLKTKKADRNKYEDDEHTL